MAQTDRRTSPAATVDPVVPEALVLASRDAWLGELAPRRAEKVLHIEGIGEVLLTEISALARAEIMTIQSAAVFKEGDAKMVDYVRYQKTLLQAGVVDPLSPENGRLPLFKAGDMERVMQLGASKITQAVETIEELSRLGNYVRGTEGNSAPIPNGAGTSE